MNCHFVFSLSLQASMAVDLESIVLHNSRALMTKAESLGIDAGHKSPE
jgi:hypothetical protein